MTLFILIILLITNIVICKNYDLVYLTSGLDHISLLGSNIIYNDKFIFVSSNGYNIFNGMVICYYYDLFAKNNTLKIHSIIYSPETLNSNFGVKINIHNDILIISAIADNIYTGKVYVYKLYNNRWFVNQELKPINNNYLFEPIIGFGYDIAISDTFLAIGCTSGQIYLYLLSDEKYKLIGIIKGNMENNFGNKITFYENILFTSLNYYGKTSSKYNYLDNTTEYDYVENITGNNLEKIYIYDNLNNSNKLIESEVIYGYDIDKLFSLNMNAQFIKTITYKDYDYKIKPPTDIKCKYFGSNIKFLNNILIISCSIPYPFYNYDTNNYEPIIIVYSIKYNKDIKYLEYNLKQLIIQDKNNKNNDNYDIYFGTNYDFDENNIFIAGTNKIYEYPMNENGFGIVIDKVISDTPANSYELPDNIINNDYKVKIVKKNILIGSYSSIDLRGSLYSLKYITIPDISNNENIDIQKINSIQKDSLKNPTVFILNLLMLLFITLLILITIIYFYYCICSTNLINKKKKKEEEEENSPYKVYSYLGYSETDDYINTYINPNTNVSYYLPYPFINPHINLQFNPYINSYINSYNLNKIEKSIQQEKKTNNEKIMYKSSNLEHIISKEKVHSYKEYEFDLENNLTDDKKINNLNNEPKSKLIEQIKNNYEKKYKSLMKKFDEKK